MATMLFYITLIGGIAICPSSLNAKVYWEPCKLQCDDNFNKNEISQQTLVNVCHRGCDMFTVALITTTQSKYKSDDEETFGPMALPQIESEDESNDIIHNIHRNREQSQVIPVSKNRLLNLPPSTTSSQNVAPVEPIPQLKDVLSTHMQDSSKTTIEPTSQPVQDHPVEANKQSTTTNGPKRTQVEAGKKEISENLHLQLPSAIHIRFMETKFNVFNGLEESVSKISEVNELSNQNILESGRMNTVDRLEEAKHSCRHACVTAYGGAIEQEACIVGCHLQATSASLAHSPLDHLSLSKDTIRNPLTLIQKMFFNLAGRVGHFMRTTWSSATSRASEDTDKKNQVYGDEDMATHPQNTLFGIRPRLYVIEPNIARNPHFFKPEPEIIQLMKSFRRELFQSPSLVKKNSSKKNGHSFFKEHESNLNRRYEHHLSYQSSHDDETTKDRKNDGAQIEQPNQNSHQQIQQQLDLLECISRKSGLPRWFIATTIFASALVVLWLCFSLTAPPEDIRVVKTNVKVPEAERSEDEDYDDSYSESKNLLSRDGDVIKIRIENV